MSIERYDLKDTFAGNTYPSFSITGIKSGGSAMSASLASARLQVRKHKDADSAVVSLTSSSGITIDDADAWALTIGPFYAPTQARDYVYDLELTDSNGVVQIYMRGNWRVLQPICRRNDTIYEAFMRDSTLDAFLFSDYANKVWSPTCWARQFDLSGVSWESTAYDTDAMRTTLIGRDCFLTAKHYTVPVGTVVTFTDRFGGRFEYEVAAISASDLNPLAVYDGRVGTFTETVSPTLTSYEIETSPSSGDWLLATRSRFSVASHLPFSQKAMIERITNWYGGPSPNHPSVRWFSSVPYFAGTMPSEVAARRYSANLYDSSDALFTFSDGKLKLLSTYFGVTVGPYYGLPSMLAQIDEFLTANSSARVAQEGVAN